MEFRSKHGPIPDSHFDSEVPVKKNPDDCYSAEFVKAQNRRVTDFKVGGVAATTGNSPPLTPAANPD